MRRYFGCFLLLGAVLAAPFPLAAQVLFEDGFETCAEQTTRTCYSGGQGTEGVGICQAGMQRCVNGAWSACASEQTPVFESCNAVDDDCDSALDDGLGSVTCGTGACKQTVAACAGGNSVACTPALPAAETCDGIDNDCDGAIDEDGCNCVHVSLLGNDLNAGTAASPKRTINAAITTALNNGPNVVCVASGITCFGAANFDEAVVMANGVHVYGGYQQTGMTWPRVAGCVTRIRGQDALGVSFGPSVTAPTILDGFEIVASNSATSAAVTVQGSTGAEISDNVITGGTGTTSYGINVIDNAGAAATPAISQNVISGGSGTALSIGVRSLNSAPKIQANCGITDASGRCTTSCPQATAIRSIRGRSAGGSSTESYGVRLESSPGALVSQNSICGGSSTADSAALRLSGDANGTVVRGNFLNGGGGQLNDVGVWLDACAGASPWVVDNSIIQARALAAPSRADGVRALGNCPVRIERNVRILGSSEGSVGTGNGVFCGAANRCTIIENTQIIGSGAGTPPSATGIRCEDGACAIIQGNAQVSGRGGVLTTGIALGASGTLVDSNLIQAGCATTSGMGLHAIDSFARIQNNRIEGTGPACAVPAPTSYGVLLVLGAGASEIDLHSNDLVGQIGGGSCTSRGLAFAFAVAPPTGGRGLVRNNIVSAGECNTRYAIDEMAAGADPRVLQNNDLWAPVSPTMPNPPTALYRDEAATNISSIATVNALGDVTASGNISADPLYTGPNELSSASPARDAGRPDGAPPKDFEGDARPQGPAFDIGRDEFTP